MIFSATDPRVRHSSRLSPTFFVAASITSASTRRIPGNKAAHRLLKRFREAIRAELAEIVAAKADIKDELRHFARILARPA